MKLISGELTQQSTICMKFEKELLLLLLCNTTRPLFVHGLVKMFGKILQTVQLARHFLSTCTKNVFQVYQMCRILQTSHASSRSSKTDAIILQSDLIPNIKAGLSYSNIWQNHGLTFQGRNPSVIQESHRSAAPETTKSPSLKSVFCWQSFVTPSEKRHAVRMSRCQRGTPGRENDLSDLSLAGC